MTARHLVEVTPSELQEMAFNSGAEIEIDTVDSRAFVRIGTTTYVAQIAEVTC